MTHQLPPEVTVPLARVLVEEVFDLWADTPIQRLGGRTPYQVIADGDLDVLVELVNRYSDPSFT